MSKDWQPPDIPLTIDRLPTDVLLEIGTLLSEVDLDALSGASASLADAAHLIGRRKFRHYTIDGHRLLAQNPGLDFPRLCALQRRWRFAMRCCRTLTIEWTDPLGYPPVKALDYFNAHAGPLATERALFTSLMDVLVDLDDRDQDDRHPIDLDINGPIDHVVQCTYPMLWPHWLHGYRGLRLHSLRGKNVAADHFVTWTLEPLSWNSIYSEQHHLQHDKLRPEQKPPPNWGTVSQYLVHNPRIDTLNLNVPLRRLSSHVIPSVCSRANWVVTRLVDLRLHVGDEDDLDLETIRQRLAARLRTLHLHLWGPEHPGRLRVIVRKLTAGDGWPQLTELALTMHGMREIEASAVRPADPVLRGARRLGADLTEKFRALRCLKLAAWQSHQLHAFVMGLGSVKGYRGGHRTLKELRMYCPSYRHGVRSQVLYDCLKVGAPRLDVLHAPVAFEDDVETEADGDQASLVQMEGLYAARGSQWHAYERLYEQRPPAVTPQELIAERKSTNIYQMWRLWATAEK